MSGHLTNDGFESFDGSTADGILAFVDSTRPTPADAEVATYVRGQLAAARLPAAEVAKLAERYPALRGPAA